MRPVRRSVRRTCAGPRPAGGWADGLQRDRRELESGPGALPLHTSSPTLPPSSVQRRTPPTTASPGDEPGGDDCGCYRRSCEPDTHGPTAACQLCMTPCRSHPRRCSAASCSAVWGGLVPARGWGLSAVWTGQDHPGGRRSAPTRRRGRQEVLRGAPGTPHAVSRDHPRQDRPGTLDRRLMDPPHGLPGCLTADRMLPQDPPRRHATSDPPRTSCTTHEVTEGSRPDG